MNKQINLIEKYFVINESVQPVSNFTYSYSSNAKILYEVIRVKNSTPIFLEQHLNRLWKSINLLGLFVPDRNLTTMMIVDLLRANPVVENNIRISLVYGLSAEPDLLVYFIPSSYPTDDQKANGINVKTLNAYRNNPNIKMENGNLREKADRIIGESGCYEVLLVNREGFITEGSRSNIFFIKDSSLITPPIGIILGGITRQVVINISKDFGIPVIEKLITVDSLSSFDGAILTGTSPGVLPIASINNQLLKVKLPQILSLISRYNMTVANDISNFKMH